MNTFKASETKNVLFISSCDAFAQFNYPPEDLSAEGYNSGNNAFIFALQKLTLDPSVKVDVRPLGWVRDNFEKVNEEYMFGFTSLANMLSKGAARNGFDPWHDTLRKLSIPVHVIGIGAQSGSNYDLGIVNHLKKEGYKFIKRILDLGGHIGVRGYFSAEVINKLGFKKEDSTIIGCPSIFINGPNLCIEKKHIEKKDLKPIFNGRIFWNNPDFHHYYNEYPQSIFICQDVLYTLLYALDKHGRRDSHHLRGNLFYDLYKDNRVRLYGDIPTWIDSIKNEEFNFSIGGRIHGNIISLLAGIPCHVDTIDSRLREMVEYYHIPHSALRRQKKDIFTLYCESDFSDFNKYIAIKFNTLKSFFDKCGLPCYNNPDYINSKLSSLAFSSPPLCNSFSKIEELIPLSRKELARKLRKRKWWYRFLHLYWMRNK